MRFLIVCLFHHERTRFTLSYFPVVCVAKSRDSEPCELPPSVNDLCLKTVQAFLLSWAAVMPLMLFFFPELPPRGIFSPGGFLSCPDLGVQHDRDTPAQAGPTELTSSRPRSPRQGCEPGHPPEGTSGL